MRVCRGDATFFHERCELSRSGWRQGPAHDGEFGKRGDFFMPEQSGLRGVGGEQFKVGIVAQIQNGVACAEVRVGTADGGDDNRRDERAESFRLPDSESRR